MEILWKSYGDPRTPPPLGGGAMGGGAWCTLWAAPSQGRAGSRSPPSQGGSTDYRSPPTQGDQRLETAYSTPLKFLGVTKDFLRFHQDLPGIFLGNQGLFRVGFTVKALDYMHLG